MKIITGQFQLPNGNPAANATLKLQLSQDATTGGQQIAPVVYYITLDTNGNIPSGTEISANDELSPNTFYIATLTMPSLGRIYGPENFPIVGTSPINLNTIIPAQLPLPATLADLTFTANTDFSAISSGENIQAEMTVGSGASLEASGSGVINATEINGISITGTLTHAGQIPISQPGNASAVWADPLVQGLYATGTAVSGINPVLIGAANPSADLANLQVDSSGNLFVNISNASIAVTGTFWQATQPISAASLPLPTGAATSANQSTELGYLSTLAGAVSSSKVQANITNSSLAVTGTFWQTTQPVSGTFWQATQPVSGTFWQSTQPVSLASLPALASGSNLVGQVEVSNGSNVIFTSSNPGYVYDVPVVRSTQGSQSTTITSSTGSTTVITGISSTYADIFSLTITNSSGTGTTVTLSDGTVSREYYVAPGFGFTLNLNGGVLAATSSNTNWTLTCGTSVASVYVVAEFYKRSS